MNNLLVYLAPPMLGAFIGYMTNYIAIRMLFKPLKPWRIFGIRVPMTPGVIPAKRHELAQNIGEMVGEHLLSGPDIRKALEDKKFRIKLKTMIEERFSGFMNKELGPVASLIPSRFQAYFEVGVKILRWRSLKALYQHVQSDSFTKSLTGHIDERLDDFFARPIDAMWSAEDRAHFYNFIEKTTVEFLAGPGVEQWIRDAIRQRFTDFLAEDRSINDLIPVEISEQLIAKIEQEAPSLLRKFAELIKEPRIQMRIADGISAAVANFAQNLGPMAAFLGGFISPDTIRDKVCGFLNDKGNAISDWLVDESVQDQIARILRTKARDLLNTPVSDLLKNVEQEKKDKAKDWLADQIINILQKPQTAAALAALLRDATEAHTGRTFHSVCRDIFGEKTETWKQKITGEIIAIIQSHKLRRLLDKLLADLIDDKLFQTPIGTLANFLPKEVRRALDDYAFQFVSDILVKEVPALMNTLNIREVVTRKVDSLNLVRLEGLLLVVMQEQFKYINLFGALLGFIIGLFNILFFVYL